MTEVEVVEAGAGPTLVAFVHGVLDRGRSFGAVAERLRAECRTLQYDRRGYGEPVADPPPVSGHADDLLELLDGRPAVVVGHSFGGVTALATAVRAPDLVQAVVLYETPIAWAPGWDDATMEALLADDDPAGTGLRLLFGDRLDAMGDDERATRRARAAAFVAEERSVRGGPPPFALSEVRAPVLYGAGDPARTAAVVEHLRREVSQVELAVLPGADHHAHRSAPGPFADLVRRGVELAHGGGRRR